MDSSNPVVFRRKVSLGTFGKLCCLWQQTANQLGREAILLTEETIFAQQHPSPEHWEDKRLRLLVAPQFNALLLGQLEPSHSFYQISLTWDRWKIQDLLTELTLPLGNSYPLQDVVNETILKQLSGNQLTQPSPTIALVNQFLTKLLELLCPNHTGGAILPNVDCNLCQPVEQALRQQVEQERLLHQVITQIRNSLDLPVVLETAVKEARNFLQVDRLLIYQFYYNLAENLTHNLPKILGKITYESRASLTIPSILNLSPEEDCFSYVPHYQEKYRRGLVVAIEDVQQAYSSSFCLAEFLRRNCVRSCLIAPIVVQEKLWGLIIAHSCFSPRQWCEQEKVFLGKIGEHLAIAIHQSQLYTELQQQKNHVEKRVLECTQELRDTLLAAQVAHQSKSEFLANVSHELLTPLTCIIGLSGTLLYWSGNRGSLSQEKYNYYLKNIQENGKKLLGLINDILEYSRIYNGSYKLNIEKICLFNLCQFLTSNFRQDAEEKKIELNLDFQVNEDNCDFYADGQRLCQMLGHLLSNAIKFTPNNGQVTLRVWKENNYAFFQVEDTGIGISEEQIPLLFQEFQQLEKSRQRTHGGTGLGLALTKQLVELHGGNIEVESIPKRGSLFTVRLPNHNHINHQKKTCYNKELSEIMNRTIVLVSHDEEVSTLICELLTANKYQVIWLFDSYTLSKQIEIILPSIVIIDRDDFSDFALIQQIKSSHITKGVKLIILQKDLEFMNWKNIVNQGIDDYLLKPINPSYLLNKIEFWLNMYQPVEAQ